MQYFQAYIKTWNDHADIVEKNARKFLDPIALTHEKSGSRFKDFVKKVDLMDLEYSAKQRVFAKKVQ